MAQRDPKPDDALAGDGQRPIADSADSSATVPPAPAVDAATAVPAGGDPFSTVDTASAPASSPSGGTASSDPAVHATAAAPIDYATEPSAHSGAPVSSAAIGGGEFAAGSGSALTGDVGKQSATGGETRTLGGFRLLRELGRGGMGVVYEAEPVGGGPTVALKTLAAGSQGSLARFKSEFRVLADLSHRNLVRLGELNVTAEQPFFTMEVVRGCRLDQYVRSSFESAAAMPQLPYNEARLRDALAQLASGLTTLHQAGCIHRDIKPSNVLVTSEGRVVIVDFGIALDRSLEQQRLSKRGLLAGTPYYMAPEIALGNQVTPASDWYAVGVLLFEALTGEPAFQAHRFDALQKAKLDPERPEPKSIVSQIPEDLNRLCCALMQPRPQDRPDGPAILRQWFAGQSSTGTMAGATIATTPTAGQSGELWIGRQAELVRLHAAWRDATGGQPRVVRVWGTSGVGKTALVNHFLAQLRRREKIVVLRGRCYENESVAYPGFDSVVDSLATYLSGLPAAEVERVLPLELETLCRIFPVLGDVAAIKANLPPAAQTTLTPQELRQQAITALRELLSRLARWSKLVIFIDDLQQGDSDTASLFCELFGRARAPRALVLATCRSEDAQSSECLLRIGEECRSVGDSALSQRLWDLMLDRLGDDESAQLCRRLLSGAAAPITSGDQAIRSGQEHRIEELTRRIASEAGGDPLFIHLLASHYLVEQNAAADRWTLTGLIDRQFDQMTLQEQIVMRRLAAAGRPINDHVLEMAESAEDQERSAPGTIRALMIRRWVRRLGGGREVEVFHDKIRETVRKKMTLSELRSDCLTLARLLQQDPVTRSGRGDPELLADLFRRGGDAGQSARYYIEAAAKFDAAFAFRRAAAAYQWAIEQLDPAAVARLQLREKLGHSLSSDSRSAEAAEQFLLAAESTASDAAGMAERLRLRQLAAMRLLISGHIDRGVEILQDVLGKVSLPWPKSTARAVVGLLWRNAWLRAGGLRCDHDAGDLNPVERQKLDACWTAAAGLSVVDPIRGALFVSENLILSLRSGRSPRLGRDLAAYMGHVAIGGSASRKATRRVLVASRRLVPDRHEPYQAAMLLLARGIAALLRGQWSSSRRCCDLALGRLDDPSCHGATWERSTARTFALWALQYQGNLQELARRQPDLLRLAKETNDRFATLNYGTQVTAHLELAQDRPDEALRRLDEDRQRLPLRGFFVQHHNELLARTYTLIYQGEGAAAKDLIDGRWQDYRQAFLSHVQQVRIDHLQVLTRAFLAAAAQSAAPRPLVQQVRQLVGRLRGERVAWAAALAMAMDAACEQILGEQQASKDKLDRAIGMLEAVQMGLFAAAAHLHLATISGQMRGSRLQALERWEELGVVNPTAMAATLLPGFPAYR